MREKTAKMIVMLLPLLRVPSSSSSHAFSPSFPCPARNQRSRRERFMSLVGSDPTRSRQGRKGRGIGKEKKGKKLTEPVERRRRQNQLVPSLGALLLQERDGVDAVGGRERGASSSEAKGGEHGGGGGVGGREEERKKKERRVFDRSKRV